MKNLIIRPVSLLFAFIACTFMAFTSGCASGGYKLTREYSRWVNSKSLILRIILYILTGIVFLVTMLVDMVIFNTLDFWDGKVSAGTYEFKQGDKTFVAVHEVVPETSRKKSTIRITGKDGLLLQTVELLETANGEVEMFVDGQIRTRVKNLTEIPVATVFDAKGDLVSEKFLFFNSSIAKLETNTVTE